MVAVRSRDKAPSISVPIKRESFDVAVKNLVVDDALNPRFAATLAIADETPGAEQAGLAELTESLRTLGQLQNIGVDRDPKSKRWRVRFGFRRVKAALLAGIETLRAIESTNPADALAENLGRKNLTAIEVTLEIKGLLAMDPPMTHAQIGRLVGLGRSSVTNYATIAQKLHPKVLAVWRQRPGIFKVHDVLPVAQLEAAQQVEWLQSQYGLRMERRFAPEAEHEEGEKPRGHLRSRAAGEKLRERVESGSIDKGAEWVDGALAVLSWWLDGQEI